MQIAILITVAAVGTYFGGCLTGREDTAVVSSGEARFRAFCTRGPSPAHEGGSPSSAAGSLTHTPARR